MVPAIIYLYRMPLNFSREISFDGRTVLAVIIPSLRRNGMHYEINVPGYPRFFMAWSPLGRYDTVHAERLELPYNLVLALSDTIEAGAIGR